MAEFDMEFLAICGERMVGQFLFYPLDIAFCLGSVGGRQNNDKFIPGKTGHNIGISFQAVQAVGSVTKSVGRAHATIYYILKKLPRKGVFLA